MLAPAAQRVLAYLRKWGPNTGSQLALCLDMPEPSVRRSIQELIDEGHNITFVTGRNACYTLYEEAPALAEGPTSTEDR